MVTGWCEPRWSMVEILGVSPKDDPPWHHDASHLGWECSTGSSSTGSLYRRLMDCDSLVAQGLDWFPQILFHHLHSQSSNFFYFSCSLCSPHLNYHQKHPQTQTKNRCPSDCHIAFHGGWHGRREPGLLGGLPSARRLLQGGPGTPPRPPPQWRRCGGRTAGAPGAARNAGGAQDEAARPGKRSGGWWPGAIAGT